MPRLLHVSPPPSCLYFAKIKQIIALVNLEISPLSINFINPSPRLLDLYARHDPLVNQVFRGLMDRSELYLSNGLGQSAYNNILRKQKASKNMNYCFDIQPTDQEGQILQEALPITAREGKKQNITLVIKCKKSRAKQSSFSWTKNQQRKYISFLRNNSQLFSLPAKQRKDIKINVLISSAVKSRTPAQCHSHHQKMILKHKTIQNIIDRLNDYILSKTRGETQIRMEEKAHSEGTMEPEREIQINTPQERQIPVQPAWWEYITLMDDHQQLPWSNQSDQLFFF